jgi:hypothetical protein
MLKETPRWGELRPLTKEDVRTLGATYQKAKGLGVTLGEVEGR